VLVQVVSDSRHILVFLTSSQVSFTATSPALNNTKRFPTFFRAISSDISTVAANVATIRRFGWQQVAIITQNVNLFIEVSKDN